MLFPACFSASSEVVHSNKYCFDILSLYMLLVAASIVLYALLGKNANSRSPLKTLVVKLPIVFIIFLYATFASFFLKTI